MTVGVATINDLTAIAARLPLEQLHGAPVEFAVRYLRNLEASEVAAIEAAGLQLVSVAERGRPTEAAYFTAERGAEDGHLAAKAALSLGMSDGRPIYFAVDGDIVGHDDAIAEYFAAIDDGMSEVDGCTYAIGAYGSGHVLGMLRDRSLATFFWRAGASGWTDARPAFIGAHLHTLGMPVKVLGVEVSPVEAQADDFGGWTGSVG